MNQRFAVKFMRYDESGRVYDIRIEGLFELIGGKIRIVSGDLDDILEDGDTLEDAKRKFKLPYFQIESV